METQIDWANHPIQFLLQMKGLLLPTDRVLFARYLYTPQTSTEASRIIMPVHYGDITESLVESLMDGLHEGQELALQSQVYNQHNEPKGHLLFADCVGNHEAGAFSQALPARFKINETWVYNSGRSSHGYFPGLLSTEQWRQFLGSLLLWNQHRENFFLIDERWVGHALEHSYNALRWSAHSARHTHAPIFLAKQPLLVASAGT